MCLIAISRMNTKPLSASVVAVLILATAHISNADIVTCGSGPGCLNGTDSIDWAQNYGPPSSDIPNHSIAISQSGAISATVTFGGGGDGMREDQGNGWYGNFMPGDSLLWSNSPGQGPLTLTFSQPLTGL